MEDPGCCDKDFHAQFCDACCPEYFKTEGGMASCDRTKGHKGKHRYGHEWMSMAEWKKRSEKPKRGLLSRVAVAALAALTGCATMQAQPQPPLPTVTAGPAQCLGVQAANTAWGLVDNYVRQTLEAQRVAACTPRPAPPAAPTPQLRIPAKVSTRSSPS